LTCGTSKILVGHVQIASKYAALASYFEQYMEVDFLNTRACLNWPKIRELYAADEHTLVSFLKKRIPCSCLDEKYEQVKSISKIGSRRLVFAATPSALCLVERQSAVPQGAAVDAVGRQITAQRNAKRLHGQITRPTATSTRIASTQI